MASPLRFPLLFTLGLSALFALGCGNFGAVEDKDDDDDDEDDWWDDEGGDSEEDDSGGGGGGDTEDSGGGGGGGGGGDWPTEWSGAFVVGNYDGSDFDCLTLYMAAGSSSNDLCPACDFSFDVYAEYYGGADGYDECDLGSMEYWSEIDAFTSSWSFAYSPEYYSDPVAYYNYGGEFYPAAYFYYGAQFNWLSFYADNGELGYFQGYAY